MEIGIANECDIDRWMSLVSKVKNSFPGLETKEALDEHRDTVLDFIVFRRIHTIDFRSSHMDIPLCGRTGYVKMFCNRCYLFLFKVLPELPDFEDQLPFFLRFSA